MNFWCGKCGVRRTPVHGSICEYCKSKPTLNDFACGVCGQPSWYMYVYGYRCLKHEFVLEPSQSIDGKDKCVGCIGLLLK